jgi:hypothetical protein
MVSVFRTSVKGVLFAVAAAVLMVGDLGTASAATLNLTEFGRNNVDGARAARSAFLDGRDAAAMQLGGPNSRIAGLATEDFGGFKAWDGKTGTQNPTTAVGRFTSLGGKGRGLSAINGGTKLEVRNDNPFPWARHNVQKGLGGNWLDSNDTHGMRWEVAGLQKFNALGFFVTDSADVGAKLSIRVGGTLFENVVGETRRTANGTIHWVTILLDEAVDNLVVQLRHDMLNDGFGIDGVAVAHIAPVPVPPALALALTGGLALFGLSRRRRARAA